MSRSVAGLTLSILPLLVKYLEYTLGQLEARERKFVPNSSNLARAWFQSGEVANVTVCPTKLPHHHVNTYPT